MMSYPQPYSAFRRTTGNLPHIIECTQETLPETLVPHDVIIKIHAVSLNYREIAMLDRTYPSPCKDSGIPCSDCAAEVVATGAEVCDFAVGDAVQ
jgi:NADPH:quinone reductase-like Zn-dependent oxidoreductase